ncbi:MAG: HAD family phosphatase [Gammaproteobacteria bacterium]|jgi:2-haloacid dehalogenase
MRDIVFDLGKVLVDWDPRYLFVRHLGVPAPDAERFLTEICSPSWHIELDRGRTFDEGIALLLESHGAHRVWIESYAKEWPRMFAGAISSTVVQLQELHAQGHRIHALSNYPPQQIRFLYDRFEFMQLFHTVVISGLLGIVKPDPEIFDRLLESIGADSCIFIDDREENVAAASAAGIEAIHFTPDKGPDRLAELVASVERS